MSELSIQNRPELSILGMQENPQSEQDPTADFLDLAMTPEGNRNITQILEDPEMPDIALKSYDAHEKGMHTTASPAVLALGKLLAKSRAGSWLDPDQETWGQIVQDPTFRAARETFSKLTDRDENFDATRYTMTKRMLAIFCVRRLAYEQREQAATREIA